MSDLRLKEILNQRNISVAEFAKMIGVSREHCYSIIKGKNVSHQRLTTIANVLNLPISALYQTPEINIPHSAFNIQRSTFDIVFGREEHYIANDCITFSKLNEPYGELSNMHTAYPVECCGYKFKTSEHLFIALRFSGYPDLQREIMQYPNAMWCKKIFVNNDKYKPFHHPNWHDVLPTSRDECSASSQTFDVEVMKFICCLKYQQNEGFQQLLATTRGKIIVEDTTAQNSSNSVLRWGCQDLQRKDLIKQLRKDANRYIKHGNGQKRWKPSDKEITHLNQLAKVCENTISNHYNAILSGQNAMGKILMTLRDNNGQIDYNIQYPLFLFEHEIK